MKTDELRAKLEGNGYDSWLVDIYVNRDLLAGQKQRYLKAIAEFEGLYGPGEVEVYSAPGRSEVCGNHTDHQHGRVLACAINLDAIGLVRKQADYIKIVSDDMDIPDIDINDLRVRKEEVGTSQGLVRGVIAGIKQAGYQVGGFKAYITSDVLIGAGTSSSAAFETLIGIIISGLYNNLEIDPITLAKIGQYSENVYFGKPCGLMDQMASSIGSLITIDFYNIEKPIIRRLEFDLDKHKYSLCIVDTKRSHADLTADYASIPQEMRAVAKCFNKEYLSDVNEDEFYAKIEVVRRIVGDRPLLRACHLFAENKRVDLAVTALKNNDMASFKQIIQESGRSSYQYLQNVYSSADPQNQAVSLGLCLSESFIGNSGVCRVHGGGFAGTIQAFVKNEAVMDYRNKIEKVFGKGSCHILSIRKYGGIRVF